MYGWEEVVWRLGGREVGVLSATSNAGTTVSAAAETEGSIGWSAREGRR